MKVLRAYKTELDPNDKQRTFFRQCAGAARFVYNWALADRRERYEAGLKTSHNEQKVRFNATKRELCPWIVELPYAVVEKAFADLDTAYKNFFRRVKAGETPGYPKFKSKKRNAAHFSLRSTKVEPGRVRLTGIGWVRLHEHGYIPTEGEYGIYATISERAGRWYISILAESEIADPVNDSNDILGVDLGIKSLAVCSDGTTFENPRALDQEKRKLGRLNRELARRTRGGKNWQKTKHKLQRRYQRLANVRNHALHQVSHYVTAIAKPKVVVVEDLAVQNMQQNHKIARSLSDVALAELRRQIEYKAKWYGVKVMIADRWYPSSKTCSECGATNQLLTLSDRTFVCPACGCVIDRDLNAAKNLASLAA